MYIYAFHLFKYPFVRVLYSFEETTSFHFKSSKVHATCLAHIHVLNNAIVTLGIQARDILTKSRAAFGPIFKKKK